MTQNTARTQGCGTQNAGFARWNAGPGTQNTAGTQGSGTQNAGFTRWNAGPGTQPERRPVERRTQDSRTQDNGFTRGTQVPGTQRAQNAAERRRGQNAARTQDTERRSGEWNAGWRAGSQNAAGTQTPGTQLSLERRPLEHSPPGTQNAVLWVQSRVFWVCSVFCVLCSDEVLPT